MFKFSFVISLILRFVLINYSITNISSCCCKNKVAKKKILKNSLKNSLKISSSHTNPTLDVKTSININDVHEKEIKKEQNCKFLENLELLDKEVAEFIKSPEGISFCDEISKKTNKNLKDQIVFLIYNFCKENHIENYDDIRLLNVKSLNNTICVEINSRKFYIKPQNYCDKFYFDLLKEIGLLDFKYYFTRQYILTEHVDQNIDNYDINSKYLSLGKDLDTTNLNNMLSKVKNLREYNFFCSLLKLGDCNLIYRLDNSYFKKDGDKWKVFLLDVDYPSDIDANTKGRGYDKFFNILNSKTYIFWGVKKGTINTPFVNFKLDDVAGLVSRAICLTLNEENIKFFPKNIEEIENYWPNDSKLQDREDIIPFKLEDKNFVDYIMKQNEYLNPRFNPKNKDYPLNIISTIENMYKKFMLKPDATEEGFIESILGLLYKHLGIEDNVKKNIKDLYYDKLELIEGIKDLDTFKKTFYNNYWINRTIIETVSRYKYAQEKLKPIVFKNFMDVDKFTPAEINEIKSKLQIMENFINKNYLEYDETYVKSLKSYIKQLKSNNMFPKIFN